MNAIKSNSLAVDIQLNDLNLFAFYITTQLEKFY